MDLICLLLTNDGDLEGRTRGDPREPDRALLVGQRASGPPGPRAPESWWKEVWAGQLGQRS